VPGKQPSKKATRVKAPAKIARKKRAAPKTAKAPKATPNKAAVKKAARLVSEPAGKALPRPEEPAPVPKPTRPASRYGVGDKVVHPQHGAATIAKRVKREFTGEVRDYYVLDISTESLTVMVPVDKIDAVVRSVISKTQSRNVLNSLKEEAQEAGANWSRWYKVLTEKMYSGDIFQVAEVVRDLSYAQQTKGISPALKRMLSKARMTLISELSFSLEVDEEEATRRLDKAVPKVESPLVPAL
jgi:CarD family transcriptional regulator